ncbi:PEGA domain-containing protein [Omnitrophica bacterium]|nr:PEGA domain-containing protein [Candidatus Omnitrophota bacterium]
MLRLRKILFYLFTLIYVVCCPLLILYSLGYFFDPAQPSPIIQSGLISIATIPKDAQIHIGDKVYSKTTPAEIRNLRQGRYAVRLALEGYQTWQGEVPVLPGKATVLKQILMIPENLKPKLLLADPFDTFIPIPHTTFFILSSGKHVRDLRVYDWHEEKLKSLRALRQIVSAESKIEEILTVPKSSQMILRLKENDSIRYVLGKIENGEASFKDLTDLMIRRPEKLVWDPRAPRYLFSYYGRTLDRIDSESGTVVPHFAKDVMGFGIRDRQVYVLKSERFLYRTNLNQDKKEVLLSDERLHRYLFDNDDAFDLYLFEDDLVFFRSSHGALISNLLPYHFAESGVRGLKFYKQDKQVLVWKKNRIGILSFPDRNLKESFFEKRPEIQWLYDEGEDIREAFWVYEGSHILFLDRQNVSLLEVAPYGVRRVRALARARQGTPVFYSEKTGQLHYLDSDSGRLHSLQVIPKEYLIDLILTEWDELNLNGEEEAA